MSNTSSFASSKLKNDLASGIRRCGLMPWRLQMASESSRYSSSRKRSPRIFSKAGMGEIKSGYPNDATLFPGNRRSHSSFIIGKLSATVEILFMPLTRPANPYRFRRFNSPFLVKIEQFTMDHVHHRLVRKDRRLHRNIGGEWVLRNNGRPSLEFFKPRG